MKYLFLVILFIFAGCQERQTVTIPLPPKYQHEVTPLSAFELLLMLEDIQRIHGVRADFAIEDRQYFIPKHEWVVEVFQEWLPLLIESLDIEYFSDSMDCDDFSDLASIGARLAVRDTKARITIARASLEPKNGGEPSHQLIAFISDKGIFFAEPQPSGYTVRIWKPTRADWARLYHLNFRVWELQIAKL